MRDFSLNGGYSLKSFFKMAPPDAAGVVESTTFYNALSMTNATPLEISSATLWYSVAASFIIATVAYGIVSKRLYNLMEEQNKNKEIAKRIFVGKADKERAENGDQRMFKIHWVERFVPSFLANSVFGNPMELLDTFVVAHVRATFTDSLKAFVNQVVAIDPQKQLRWDKMPRRSRRSLVGLQKTQTAKLGQILPSTTANMTSARKMSIRTVANTLKMDDFMAAYSTFCRTKKFREISSRKVLRLRLLEEFGVETIRATFHRVLGVRWQKDRIGIQADGWQSAFLDHYHPTKVDGLQEKVESLRFK